MNFSQNGLHEVTHFRMPYKHTNTKAYETQVAEERLYELFGHAQFSTYLVNFTNLYFWTNGRHNHLP